MDYLVGAVVYVFCVASIAVPVAVLIAAVLTLAER